MRLGSALGVGGGELDTGAGDAHGGLDVATFLGVVAVRGLVEFPSDDIGVSHFLERRSGGSGGLLPYAALVVLIFFVLQVELAFLSQNKNIRIMGWPEGTLMAVEAFLLAVSA